MLFPCVPVLRKPAVMRKRWSAPCPVRQSMVIVTLSHLLGTVIEQHLLRQGMMCVRCGWFSTMQPLGYTL
eukprot:3662804-Rhodomonas_salina.4